jgi:predicted Holliday junction resolvase-like endonuclease
MILFTLGYLLTTHLSTINSLKAAIASKAERTELAMMDKKLTRIEVKLEEAVLTKAEYERLREHIDRVMMEISFKLSNVEGVGNPDGK